MNRGLKNLQLIVVSCFGAAFLFLVAAVTPVQTYPPFLAKAKQLGLPAQDCTYCHVNAAGGEPFSARGNWLIAEKEKRSASAVDVAWLKDYKEEGESKEKEKEEKKTEEAPAADQKNDPGSAAAAAAVPAVNGKRRNQKGAAASASAASTVAVGRGAEPVRALSASMKGNEIVARLGNDRPGFNYVVTGAEMVDGKLQLKGMIKPTRGAAAGESASAVLVGTLSRARNPWPSANDSRAAARTRAANNNNSTAGQQGAAAATAGGNPAPSAGQTQQQGRETRNPENTAQLGSLSQSTQPTARTTQTPTAPQGQRPSAGEANEQSQSLFSGEMAVGLGCEIIYLKMQLPAKIAAAAQTQGQPVQVGVVLAPMDNKSGEEINNQLCRVVHAMSSTGGGGGDAQVQIDQLNRLLASNGGAAAARGGR